MPFRVEPFAKFEDIVRSWLDVEPYWRAPRQLTYLRSYLQFFEIEKAGASSRDEMVAGAHSIVVEEPYTDRHYIEEYSAYYATLLDPPKQSAMRLHFFSCGPKEVALDDALRQAAQGNVAEARERLSGHYLGCTTLRPIPSAPFGRTLLKPYGSDGDRTYRTVLRNCRVQLAGLDLRLNALPFEQQDLGVGACATTAIWSALSKSSRDVGMRSPTPYSVTRAATQAIVNDRHLPATSGLSVEQMAGAIRIHNLEPLILRVGKNPDLFLWALKANLQSGIPVVLYVALKSGDGHAVVVSGYRTTDEESIRLDDDVRTSGLRRLYVHDDRIGPYMKMSILRKSFPSGADVLELAREVTKNDPEDAVDRQTYEDSRVGYAIFPTYPKMRMGAVELGDVASEFFEVMRRVASDDGSNLQVDAWFEQNGDYFARLFEMGAHPDRVARFSQTLRPSRYLGILRWKLRGKIVADVLCDTTDIPRGDFASVIGVFVYDDSLASSLDSFRPALPRAVFG